MIEMEANVVAVARIKQYSDIVLEVRYMAVIYEGNRAPFLDWVYRNSLFRIKNVMNLLLSAINRGDLRRLNYNKTVFSRGSTPDPTVRAHEALPDPRVKWEGYLLSILLPCRLGTQGRLVLIRSWYPHFLDQSYAHGRLSMNHRIPNNAGYG